MPRLIFFCGHAGAGKTTLAKRLIVELINATGASFCLLDKDTLYGGYSAAVMHALTGNPNDRDSPIYLDTLRNPEYAALLDTARENLALGINVVVVGPMSREVKAHQLTDHTWLNIPATVQVCVVWVHLDEAISRRRIVHRANPNDAYKLQNWNEYRERRFAPEPARYPELLMFDNHAPDHAAYARLLRDLLACHATPPQLTLSEAPAV